MQLQSILSNVAVDLGDAEPGHEFARWSQQQLTSYFNEALCLIGSLNPGLRSKPTVIKLEPGDVQDLSCCGRLGKVMYQSDKDGNFIGAVTRQSLKLQVAWTKSNCLPKRQGAAFRLSSYTSDTTEQKIFTVNPPVPEGVDVYLKVMCTRAFDTYDLNDPTVDVDAVDCGNLAAAKMWVMFRAHFVDDERSPEYNKALQEAKMFFTLINVKYRAELLYELGILPVNKGTTLLNAANQ